MPLITITDLHKRYGGVHALRGASCTLEPGAIGLLGPNGAGKTTLIKILLGLVRPTSGTAQVLGLDAVREARAIRGVVGYAPERDAYIPNLSGARYVAFCGELSGMSPTDARKRAHEVLDYVRLGEARYRDTQTYSTGMRQRLKIAQALVHDPKLVILDEPTNGLDPAGRIEILRLCRELAERHGISLLFSSHLLPDVEAVCDQLVVVARGQVAEQGRLSAMRAAATYVDAELRGEAAAVAALHRALADGGWRVEPRAADAVRLHPAVVGDMRPLFGAAAAHQVEIRRLAPGRTTLQEVFERAVIAAPPPAGA
jgi:ABC-2 type transport system ATP-binding protein